MIEDLAVAAKSLGLELHPEKTKILSNQKKRQQEKAEGHIQIGDMKVEILAVDASTKYLTQIKNFLNVQ